jgi:hypothetical protein
VKLATPASFLVLLLIPVSVAFSQTSSGATSGRLTIANGTVSAVTNFDAPRLLQERIVAGQPYSADRVTEHTQTLTDGTHIDQKHEMSREYRDSEGRIRTERKLFDGPRAPAIAKDELPILVQIFDPVAGYSYTLDPRKLIAHRMALPPRASNPRPVHLGSGTMASQTSSKAVGQRSFLRHKIEKQSLGTEMIDGVMTEGTRIIVTTPTGAEGNDRPLTRTCEHWRSEEMDLTLLSKCSDPRTGKTTMRLDKFERAEPDPMLFQVPPEYTAVDDRRHFSIGVGGMPARPEIP